MSKCFYCVETDLVINVKTDKNPNYTKRQTILYTKRETPRGYKTYFSDSSEKAPRLYCCRLSLILSLASRKSPQQNKNKKQRAERRSQAKRQPFESGRTDGKTKLFSKRAHAQTRGFSSPNCLSIVSGFD